MDSAGSTCNPDDFSIESSLSTSIPTVGIVSWAFPETITAARIDFGRTAGAWEYRAPVDEPSQGSNQTLLLGMKGSTTYSYQIVVERDGAICASNVETITTGPIRNGLPTITLDTPRPDEVYRGFTMSCRAGGGEEAPGYAFIFDQEGDVVWWYRNSVTNDCTEAAMSYDGHYLFMGNLNVGPVGLGELARVRMDGTGEEAYDVPDLHHDFCMGPDGKVAYIEYAESGCDNIMELDPETGQTSLTYEVADADPAHGNDCHSNAINWWPEQSLYTVSVLSWNAIAAFSRTGQLSWVLGGNSPTISGASWERQHDHDLTAPNTLLLFNNEGSGATSVAREYRWTEGIATEIWSYSGGIQSNTLGSAKRLPNGNTLVAYSNNGVIHEVNAAGQLVQAITTQFLGYVTRRATLYGPPPPWIR